MIIDTDKVQDWVGIHSKICVPIGTGLLSWYAAGHWQSAISHQEIAFTIFYFCISAISGISTAVLTIIHFSRLGLWK